MALNDAFNVFGTEIDSSEDEATVECSSNRLPVAFRPIGESLDAAGKFREDFPAYVEGLVESVPGGYVTTPMFAARANEVYNLKPRPDDVYVITFPKAGTTWVQELVWMVMNNCDFKKAKRSLLGRSPFIEAEFIMPKKLYETYEKHTISRFSKLPISMFEWLYTWNIMDLLRPTLTKLMNWFVYDVAHTLEQIDSMPPPRILKTHLPFYLLNSKLLDTSKVVYVARNPKDIIVSYYHFHRLMKHHEFTGSFDNFVEYFMQDRVYGSPLFPHLLDAWSKRHHPNMLFMFYEDLKRDLAGEVRKVAEFLGKSLSEEDLSLLTKHLQIENFSKNEAVNYEVCKKFGFMDNKGHFIRTVGDWKNHFSDPLNQRVDDWIETKVANSGLQFANEESSAPTVSALGVKKVTQTEEDTDDLLLIDNRI